MVISSQIPYDQRWFQLRITFSDSQKVPVLTNSNVDQDLGSSSESSVPLPHHPPVVYNMSSSLYWKSPIWDLPSTDIYGTRILHMNPWQKTSSTLTHPFWLSSPPGRSSIPPTSPAPNLGDLRILSGTGRSYSLRQRPADIAWSPLAPWLGRRAGCWCAWNRRADLHQPFTWHVWVMWIYGYVILCMYIYIYMCVCIWTCGIWKGSPRNKK